MNRTRGIADVLLKWQEDVEVVLGEGQATEVLVVHVQHIAALFKSLQWAYKQNYFPFMQVPRPMHQSIYI
jgi:hypothetical protein